MKQRHTKNHLGYSQTEASRITMTEPETFEVCGGEPIEVFAARMIAMSINTGMEVHTSFSCIPLRANGRTSVDEIVRAYWDERKRREKEYANSPEGKRARREARKEERKRRVQLRDVMAKLPDLNFSDMDAVIAWLGELQGLSSSGIHPAPWQHILEIFKAHGFTPRMNSGKNFRKEDERNFAGWLIGYALDGLECVGAISARYHDFAKQWHERFRQPAS
jgi:hypothetical protein